jgi:Nucleotidyltransferase of unknown function (DUF6036)
LAQLEPTQKSEIVAFLKALDENIQSKTVLYIIGGAAVTLAYAPGNRTSDIDVVQATAEVVKLGGAGSALAQEFGVYISPLQEITFSALAGWKDRCESHNLGLKKLTVKTADRYDIVIGKVSRFEQPDIEDILAINSSGEIDLEVLINRLNQNLQEVKRFPAYRNNAELLFEMLGRPIEFKDGKAKFAD